jgi:S-adenosylmethionine:tRNA ribosyltransferase-isomerase
MQDGMNMPGDKIYTLSDFNFDLPEELIAQYPSENRSGSRLFVLDRSKKEYEHRHFYDIGDYLKSGDMLVLNNTRVIPARMYFTRESGAVVEFVLARRLSGMRWLAISNRTKKLKNGEVLCSVSKPDAAIRIIGRLDEFLEIETETEFTDSLLKDIGEIPLPPYIKRVASASDIERYQTVYAKEGSAAAAPTAGLHFTDELISVLKSKGVQFAEVTLNVSWGTFQPVRSENIQEHKMHSEHYELDEQTAEAINCNRKNGGRIIAVGTTSLRVLETSFRDGKNIPGIGDTDIFIYPPYKIKSIDAMITNFHTPGSTLLMLVSAFAGYEKIIDAYKTAVEQKYRFFSYGDSMLML